MPADPERPNEPPGARLASDTSGAVLHLSGTWRLAALPVIYDLLAGLDLPKEVSLEGSAVTEIDTAAALALLSRLHAAGADPTRVRLAGFSGNEARIVEQVSRRFDDTQAPARLKREGLVTYLGEQTVAIIDLILGHLNFLGMVFVGLAKVVLKPTALRQREFTVQLEQVCLNAIPVVALVTLLIGVVVAYLLGLQAEQYGANIFVVDGVGIGATREFAPIIVAVIVAGRSGAAFTAQLGSMRLNEETDAIQTLGLSPLDVLVLPRVLALMMALPLLVFVGDVMSIAGAILIADPMLDITPHTFLARLQENLAIKHVYAGLIKAPVFALFIAVIGCRMGMTVERDTRALGLATTSTVVQSIVAVILLDAAFAVLFQELGI